MPYNLRNSSEIKPFSLRTELFKKSILSDVIRKWNELPENVLNVVTCRDFVKEMSKKYVLN